MFESETDTEVIPKLMKYLYDSEVCVCVCVCEYMYVCTHVGTRFCVHLNRPLTHVHAYTLQVNVCVHVCVNIHVYVHVHVSFLPCICTCMIINISDLLCHVHVSCVLASRRMERSHLCSC